MILRSQLGIACIFKTYHNNSRCTETTLATVGNGHALLDGMGIVYVSDSLNSDDMFAVDAHQRGNASVDGSMVNLLCRWVDMRYNLKLIEEGGLVGNLTRLSGEGTYHRTGTTTSLGTTQLRSSQPHTS